MTLENIVIGLLVGAVVGTVVSWLINNQHARVTERMSDRWRNENERDRGKS